MNSRWKSSWGRDEVTVTPTPLPVYSIFIGFARSSALCSSFQQGQSISFTLLCPEDFWKVKNQPAARQNPHFLPVVGVELISTLPNSWPTSHSSPTEIAGDGVAQAAAGICQSCGLGQVSPQPVCSSAKQKDKTQRCIRPFSTHNSLWKLGGERGSGLALSYPRFSGLNPHPWRLKWWKIIATNPRPCSELLCSMAK